LPVAVSPWPVAAQRPGAPVSADALVALRGAGYEIHAPTEADGERARQGVSRALAEYARIFGEPPPEVEIVRSCPAHTLLQRPPVRGAAERHGGLRGVPARRTLDPPIPHGPSYR
jgi:hypothetical protein